MVAKLGAVVPALEYREQPLNAQQEQGGDDRSQRIVPFTNIENGLEDQRRCDHRNQVSQHYVLNEP